MRGSHTHGTVKSAIYMYTHTHTRHAQPAANVVHACSVFGRSKRTRRRDGPAVRETCSANVRVDREHSTLAGRTRLKRTARGDGSVGVRPA